MTVLITLTVAGADTGPFNLLTDLDAYTSAFAVGVPKASLLAGFASSAVPDYATIIRIQSTADCNNYVDVPVYITTSTTSSTSSTTTTSTTIPNTCYEFESNSYTTTFTAQYIDCDGIIQTASDTCVSPSCTYTICALSIISSSEAMNIIGTCSTSSTTTSTTTGAP